MDIQLLLNRNSIPYHSCLMAGLLKGRWTELLRQSWVFGCVGRGEWCRPAFGCSMFSVSVWVCVVCFSIGLDLAVLGSSKIWDCMYLIDDACGRFHARIF